jgi:hypothetical protein
MWFTKVGMTYQFTRQIDRSCAVSTKLLPSADTFVDDISLTEASAEEEL